MTLPFPYVTADAAKSIPVFLVSESALPGRMTAFAESEREWMTTHQFTAKPETTIVMPGKDGLPSSVLAGVKDALNIWSIAHLPAQLPAGTYRVEGDASLDVLEDLALGTALAQYLFTRYRKVERKRFTFVLPDEASVLRVTQRYEAIALARDLINTPTNDTRKGLTIEIGSTDAEGRVILSDALAEADDESPDLIIDAATLTGAARTALGTELPALFSTDATLSADLMRTSMEVADPLWPLPLWESYDRYIKSPIADITNSPNYAYGGAITAALFLKRFVTNTKHWVHIDTMAWNIDALPGRPVGGEALGLRALFTYIKERYPK